MIKKMTKMEELKVITLEDNADDIKKSLNSNECIVEMLKVLNSERERMGVDDVGFDFFCEFHRRIGKMKGTGVGIEMAGEAYMIEGLRKDLNGVSEIVKDIETGIKDHRESRIIAFTDQQKEERETDNFKTDPRLWSHQITHLSHNYHNLNSRFQKLDDGLSSYNDVIDGLVVDVGVLDVSAEILEGSLRGEKA